MSGTKIAAHSSSKTDFEHAAACIFVKSDFQQVYVQRIKRTGLISNG
jgi:hypothetical protein